MLIGLGKSSFHFLVKFGSSFGSIVLIRLEEKVSLQDALVGKGTVVSHHGRHDEEYDLKGQEGHVKVSVRRLVRIYQLVQVDKVYQLEEDYHWHLQLYDVLKQVHRFKVLMVHEQEVVLFNLMAHHEEYERQEGADRHRYGEDQRDAHYCEGE